MNSTIKRRRTRTVHVVVEQVDRNPACGVCPAVTRDPAVVTLQLAIVQLCFGLCAECCRATEMGDGAVLLGQEPDRDRMERVGGVHVDRDGTRRPRRPPLSPSRPRRPSGCRPGRCLGRSGRETETEDVDDAVGIAGRELVGDGSDGYVLPVAAELVLAATRKGDTQVSPVGVGAPCRQSAPGVGPGPGCRSTD